MTILIITIMVNFVNTDDSLYKIIKDGLKYAFIMLFILSGIAIIFISLGTLIAYGLGLFL